MNDTTAIGSQPTKGINLSSIKDIDEIFVEWEKAINLSENSADRIIAKTNYESLMAREIVSAKLKHGATVAEKIAKGNEDVIDADRKLDEAIRKENANKHRIAFLESLRNWRKFQQEILPR